MKQKQFNFEKYIFERPVLMAAFAIIFTTLITIGVWGIYLIKILCL